MDKKEGDSTKHSSRSEKKQQAENELSKKAKIDAILKKIDYYSEKNTVTDLDLYYLMKEFFRTFLDINYEFSFDELVNELDKIYLETKQREEVINFIAKVRIIEYHDSPFKEDKIKEFIKYFAELSKTLVKAGTVEKKSFWKKLQTMFKKEAPPVYEEYTSASKETFSIRKEEKKKNILPEPTEEEETSNLESVAEKEYSPIDKKLEDSSSDELSKYKQDESKKKYSKSSSSETPDLASIEAHNRMVLGKKDDEVQPQQNPEQEKQSKKGKEKKLKDSKKKEKKLKKESEHSEEQKKEQENNLSEESWVSESPNKQQEKQSEKETQNTPVMTAAPSLSEENTSLAKNKAEDKKEQKQKSANVKSISKKKAKNAKSKKEKEVDKKKKEIKSKKITQRKEKKKIINKKNKIVKLKEEKSGKTKDIDFLIKQAKKSKKKEELTDLYKQINEVYNKGDVKFKSKYYKSIMDIYKNLSKLK